MSDQPLVSIIIPTYNRAHLIGETLDSVLAQTYNNWECIVVDDGSTDGTSEVMASYIEKDSRIQYHHRPINRLSGGNAARNYGFEISKGEYVNWFDDDDIMLPEFLNLKIKVFKQKNNVCFVICSGSYVDESLNNALVINLNIETYLFKEYVLWKAHILTPSLLIRKSFLDEKKIFTTEIIKGQETDFFSRLFFEIPMESYVVINKPLFLYRQHNETKTKTNYRPQFKSSQLVSLFNNLDRTFVLRDRQLLYYFYKSLIHYYFEALSHDDIENAKKSLVGILKIIKKRNIKNYVEIFLIGNFLVLIKKGSYRVEKRWRAFKA